MLGTNAKDFTQWNLVCSCSLRRPCLFLAQKMECQAEIVRPNPRRGWHFEYGRAQQRRVPVASPSRNWWERALPTTKRPATRAAL